MQNNPLKKPSNLFHKFLIWAYRPSLDKIENINELRVSGRSPLDIPGRTMLLSFFGAIVVSIIVGNVFIIGLYEWMEGMDLERVETMKIPAIDKNTATESVIISKLIPHLSPRLNDAKPEFRDKIGESFPEGKITISNITKFIRSDTSRMEKIELKGTLDTNLLKTRILGGRLKRKFFGLIPSFEPISVDKLADEYCLFKKYDEEPGVTHKDTWSRFIFISAVQSLRSQLNDGIHRPRRMLQALGGGIQWITFIIAVWCLILLLLLRIPWAKLQTRLVVEKKLPWDKDDLNIWDIRANRKYFSELDSEQNYPRMFLPVRLIKGVLNTRRSDKSLSVYQITRERIEAYRNAIDIGEYEIINFLLWATPTFGFIGTIFGIITAMENAASIFAAATAVEQSIALDKVSTSLGTAFDTSFVALITLVPMSFFVARSRKMEANLFEELELEATSNLPFLIEDEATA